MEQPGQRKFPSARGPAAAAPLDPGAPRPAASPGSPRLRHLRNHVVNTRSPGRRAPPPGLRRAARQVMNGLTMPGSFSHAGTRTRAPRRRRFNAPVTATANRINGPPSDAKKGAHACFPGLLGEAPDPETQPRFPRPTPTRMSPSFHARRPLDSGNPEYAQLGTSQGIGYREKLISTGDRTLAVFFLTEPKYE